MTPGSGPTTGGTLVTIQGTYFQARGSVMFVGPTGASIGACEWDNGAGTYSTLSITYGGRVLCWVRPAVALVVCASLPPQLVSL